VVEDLPNAEKSARPANEQLSALPVSFPNYLTVANDDILSFASNNSGKYGRRSKNEPTEGSYPLVSGDVWTLISTTSFASANKCPQENIPKEVETRVSQQLINAFLKLIPGSKSVTMSLKHLQLWGAALPANVLSQDFIHDGEHCIGVVGDWLVHGSMEGALHSGIMLADFLNAEGVSGSMEHSAGGKFQPLPKALAVQTQLTDSNALMDAVVEDVTGPRAPRKGKSWGKGDRQRNGYEATGKGNNGKALPTGAQSPWRSTRWANRYNW